MSKSAKSEFENDAVRYLRDRGFIVGRASSSWKMPSGLKNWPDLICIRFDQIWLVEVKLGADTMKEGQIKFAKKLEPHLGEHVHYRIASTMLDFEEIYKESKS